MHTLLSIKDAKGGGANYAFGQKMQRLVLLDFLPWSYVEKVVASSVGVDLVA